MSSQLLDGSRRRSAHRQMRTKRVTKDVHAALLRIGDTVTCERARLDGSNLLLYQAKTGTPVYCPLPPIVVDALKRLQPANLKYSFWTGNGKRKSAVADAQRSFRALFENEL